MGALLDFFLPSACAGCGVPPEPLCRACQCKPKVVEEELAGSLLRYSLELNEASLAVLSSYKDRGMLALERYLASHLSAVARTYPSADWLAHPPRNPQNFRRRGYDPIERLVRRSGLLEGQRRLRLQPTRALSDQRKLTARARRENLSGGLHCQAGTGTVLVVDDVVTTGSTASEMVETLQAAGYEVVGICAIARRLQSEFPPRAKKA